MKTFGIIQREEQRNSKREQNNDKLENQLSGTKQQQNLMNHGGKHNGGPFLNREKEALKKNLKELELSDANVQYVRILLTGQIGAGKSSFINTVNSAFQGRITSEALADADTGTSFTKTYRTYYIRDGESALPFVFNDIMGLEAGESHGAHQEDIAKCLEGLLKEGHNFNPVISSKKEDCRSKPSTEDLTYCLVYVIAADKVSMMEKSVIQKMRDIRQKASDLEIPQAIIMTKVDEICPLVRKDLRKIYTSKKIKEKMQQCSNSVGVPMSHIFPVKNYHEEIDTNDDMDVLILRALTQIVQIADDLLKRRKYDLEKGKTASYSVEKS
ncbi:interferon-induced 44-like protein [Labeo rohita]|uniref:Interferon-induced 44-like protein n=1 Tax=Labeo rohita TaxID=84645 RepID=A0A498LD04_LABRO|nr:interferon-induced 44-like protein [Labeo rohita]